MISFQTIWDAFSMINSIMLPVGNLGVMRSQMPQIDEVQRTKFISWISARKIGVKRTKVRLVDLHLTQNEINKAKVWKLMQLSRNKGTPPPIIVSKDGYVIDGSHRFVAQLNINRHGDIDAYVIDMLARDLIVLVQQFPQVKYRNHSDSAV